MWVLGTDPKTSARAASAQPLGHLCITCPHFEVRKRIKDIINSGNWKRPPPAQRLGGPVGFRSEFLARAIPSHTRAMWVHAVDSHRAGSFPESSIRQPRALLLGLL